MAGTVAGTVAGTGRALGGHCEGNVFAQALGGHWVGTVAGTVECAGSGWQALCARVCVCMSDPCFLQILAF